MILSCGCGLTLPSGVHGKTGGGGGVGSCDGGLNVLSVTVGQDDLFEVKTEGSGTGEGSGGLGLCNGTRMVAPWGTAMVWSRLKTGSATTAWMGWPDFAVAEVS